VVLHLALIIWAEEDSEILLRGGDGMQSCMVLCKLGKRMYREAVSVLCWQ